MANKFPRVFRNGCVFEGFRQDDFTNERYACFDDPATAVDVYLYESDIRSMIAEIYRRSIRLKPYADLRDLFDLSRFDQPLVTERVRSFTLEELQCLFNGMYGDRELDGLLSDTDPYVVVGV